MSHFETGKFVAWNLVVDWRGSNNRLYIDVGDGNRSYVADKELAKGLKKGDTIRIEVEKKKVEDWRWDPRMKRQDYYGYKYDDFIVGLEVLNGAEAESTAKEE